MSAPGAGRARPGIARPALAGLACGLLILGASGRLLMRALTLTLVEPPRFSWRGTLLVLASGAVWGAVTGPLLLPIRAAIGSRPGAGAAFGAASLLLAGIVFLAAGGAGDIEAPPLFLLLSGLSFPALFLVFGLAVDRLV